jgi:RNase H-like domain found in reverse transcriptase/Integrase zinc binding domain
LESLGSVLQVCEAKGLRLHPKKCQFYAKEAKWCGRIISGNGVKHDPVRVKALQCLPVPTTGADLQQYICALNWMRASLPGYNALVHPLSQLMEKVYAAAGGKRTKQGAAKVLLKDIGWRSEHETCLEKTKGALDRVVELAHPDPERRICVFADASENHWGAVITQVPLEQLKAPLEIQEHQPLMFLSGTISGAAQRWAIVEKEAYAIVETLVRADYLLHPVAGFDLFTDHRNLKYIFSPTAVVATVPRYTAQKLERWALLLMGYSYTIHDIAGEANVWADLLSRWGSSLKTICALQRVPLLVSPLRSQQFTWPTTVTIAESQAANKRVAGLTLSEEDPVELSSGEAWNLLLRDGVWWIPDQDTELQMRLCVCAHASLGGHRTAMSTLKSLLAFCTWEGMKRDVEFFVRRCLHCASVAGQVARPLGEALHSDRANGLLH